MLTLLFVLLLVSVTYVVAATIHQKYIPDSISAIVYTFGKPGRLMWILWMWTCAFLLAPILIEAMPDNRQFLAFFTVSALAFCGAMPLVLGESNDAHNLCGIAAGILSQLCMIYICRECVILWMLLPILRFLLTKESFNRTLTFILEVICWSTIILALFIHYTIII